MADVNANIDINIDTSDALNKLKSLQAQISKFHSSISRSSEAAALAQKSLQKNLLNSVNAIGAFSAELRTVKTTAESFTSSLEGNKFSMREYFRYAAASTKTFGRLFKSEFDTIGKVTEDRVKTLQTQYIKLGRDASGAMKALAIIPDKLDMSNQITQTQIAAQRQAIFNQLMKQGSTNLLNFGKNTQWAGRQLMVGFSLPLASFGMAASRTFMDMEQQALRFKKVYGDLFTPPAEAQQQLDAVKALGREFTKYGVAVSDTVGLAAEAAAAGFQGVDLQRQTTAATRLSVLGQIDNQQALQTTISLQSAFNTSSAELATTIDFLNAVENQTVTSLDDITVAIPKVAPVIKQLGGNVKDLAFFLTAMKEGGVNASEGANALKSGLAALINPTTKASNMLASMGININKIVESNKGDLRATVISFAQALDTLAPLQRARAIETMFGKFQFARLSTLFQNVTKDGTQAARVLDLANSSVEDLASLSEKELGMTADSAMNKFKKSVEDLKLALVPVGETFLKAVTPIVDFVSGILDKFNNLSDGTKKFITLMTVGVAGVGPILLMTFGLLANGIANIIKLFLTLRNGYLRLTGQSQVLGEQTQYLTTEQLNAQAAAHSLNQSHANLTQTFNVEKQALMQLIAAYESATRAASSFAMANPGMMIPKIGKKYAKGKPYVVGGSGNQDSEPAMLAPGETVIPANMSKKYGGLINGIIADNIPGYRRGLEADDESFASRIAQTAPTRSQSGVEAFLIKELKAMPEELVADFKSLVETVSQEITLSAAQLRERFRDFRAQYNSNIGQQLKPQFAHLGGGLDLSARSLQQSGAITDPYSMEKLNQLTRVLPDKKVSIKTGFGFDIIGRLNNLMGSTGANLEEVINDFNEKGINKWKTMVKIGGGNFESMIGDITQYDQEISKILQTRMASGKTILVDTQAQVEAARATALKQGKAFDESIYLTMESVEAEARSNLQLLGTELEQVIQTALNTITEVRVNLSESELALVGTDFFGVDGRKYGRLARGGSAAGRKFGGQGTVTPELEQLAIRDAQAYTQALENNTQDIYLASRDRKSPHIQVTEDAIDDATQYDKTVEKTLKAKRKRRIATRPQGPANIGPGMPIGATALDIVSKPTASDLRKTKIRNTALSAMGRAKGLAGKFATPRVGLGVSSALMMGSMLPGVAGQISGTLSQIGFFGQAISMLPGPLKLAAVAAGGLYAAHKLLATISENARLKIEGLGDVASVSGDKLKTLGNFFNVATRKLPYESIGTNKMPVSVQQKSKIDELRANPDFKKDFKNDIKALKGASATNAKMVLNSMALQLNARGFAQDQIKTIIQALQIESGKTDLRLNFKEIGVASDENIKKQASVIAQKFTTAFGGATSKTRYYTKDRQLMKETMVSWTKSQQALMKAGASSMFGIYQSLIGQLQVGTIDATKFNKQIATLNGQIAGMPEATQLAFINEMFAKLGPAAVKATAGIKGAHDQLNAFLALSYGGIDVDSKILEVLRNADKYDSKTVGRAQMQLSSAVKKGLAIQNQIREMTMQESGTTTGNGTATDTLSKEAKLTIARLQEELDKLKTKRDLIKDTNDELKRQYDYQQKLMNLQQEAVQAKISGNYIGAAIIEQQKTQAMSDFKKETESLALDKKITDLENRISALQSGERVKTAKTALDKAQGKIPGKALGGLIKGPGTAMSDSIKARIGYAAGGQINLSNGEYVMRNAAVRSYGVNFMNAVNSGNLQATPASSGTVYNIDMTINGGNNNPEQIADIVIKKFKVATSRNNKSNAVMF